jgi:antitoxin (DNA-binding transcriptional repressor) of toxin-antitoxin stability system
MTTVTVRQAQMYFSRLLRLVKTDHLVRYVKSVTKRVPLSANLTREPGVLKGIYQIPDSFFDPLPTEELEAWE